MNQKRNLFRRKTRAVLASAVMSCASAAMAQTIPSAIQNVTVTPRPPTPASYFYPDNATVPVEDNYIPNVVWRENGAASYQALKVQAVAARGYMYYKLSQTPNGGKSTTIADGTSDQVYSFAGTAPFTRATANATQMNYLRAADETEREILITTAGEPVCMFYVAGARPDTSTNAATIWPMGAPLGQWETGDTEATTQHYVTYNRGLTGASVQPTTLGSLSNPVNRGAMSQNGSDFLSDGRSGRPNPAENFTGWDYLDIIKYYYGQDTQLALARVPTSGWMPAFVKQIASFDYTEGYLRNRMNYSTTNSGNILYATSSHARDATTAQSGAASQKIILDIDQAAPTGNFTYRHMSGMAMGTEANPTINDNLIGTKSANLLIENRGSIGFWMKTTTAGLSARPLLDDGAASTEQGVLRNIVADGQWHKYEWYLSDNVEWTSFSGGNNAISGNWTLDSILFSGSGDTTFNIDNVFYDASTTPPVNQWVYDGNGTWGVLGNWVNAIPDNLGAVANFLNKTTGRRVVTIASPVSVGTINFNQPLGYEIFNDSPTFLGLTLDVSTGSAAINVQSTGTQTISSGVNFRDNTDINVTNGGTLLLSGFLSVGANGVGKTLNKVGPGTLTISGTQSHQPGTVLSVAAGVVNLDSDAGTNMSLNLTSLGKVVLGADQNLRGLTFAASGAAPHTLDLKTPAGAENFRSLRIFAADLAAAKASLYTAIVNPVILGGDGFIDTGLAAHPGSAIGLAQVADHIFIRTTRIGDLNLDGDVTISDFIDLAANFNAGNATWQEGDLNRDRMVTISDFIDLAANFGSSYSGKIATISDSDRLMLAGFASSVGVDPAVIGSSVPEPGTLGILIGLGAFLARRRRSQSQA